MLILWLCAPIFLSSVVMTMYSSKAIEGYPAGYLPKCPGSLKPVVITPKTLKQLTITVIGTKSTPTTKGMAYNYFQTKALASDPTMDYSKKTIMYVGGYMDSVNFPLASTMKSHYGKLGYNVWLIDLNRFTTSYYPVAVRMVREAGKRAGEMLANVTAQNTGFDPKKFEMVGISLGGQTISFIAKSYKELTGQKLSRITGLDASGPCFRNLGPELRLDESDADKVDVIATNIDGFGNAAPVGHVNFYVNGGEYQPGDIPFMPCNVLCSHMRAFFLWLSMLENPNSFIAMQCDSVQQARNKECYDRIPIVTNVAGLNTDFSKPGIYYLPTVHYFPYHMGKKGLNKTLEAFNVAISNYNSEDVLRL